MFGGKISKDIALMTILNIGNEAFNSTDVAEKVQNDINFLLTRIEHLQQQLNLISQALVHLQV